MKVAICISGHLRNFEGCLASLRTNLMDGHDCDVFIHTWDRVAHVAAYHRSDVGHDSDSAEMIAKVSSWLKPKAIVVEKSFLWDLGERHRVSLRAVQPHGVHGIHVTIPTMFYKIKCCNDLKSKHEAVHGIRYDMVVRTRADVFYESKINLAEMDKRFVYVPTIPLCYQCKRCLNDQIAIGSSENMDTYAKAFDHLEAWAKSVPPHNDEDFRSEKFMRWYFNQSGLVSSYIGANYSLLRMNGRKDHFPKPISTNWVLAGNGRAIENGNDFASWTERDGNIVVTYDNVGAGESVLKKIDDNTLVGSHIMRNGMVFDWVLARITRPDSSSLAGSFKMTAQPNG